MPDAPMKHRRGVHKSTAGMLNAIPVAVDLVGTSPPHLTTNTVAPLQQRVTANPGSFQSFSARPHKSGLSINPSIPPDVALRVLW